MIYSDSKDVTLSETDLTLPRFIMTVTEKWPWDIVATLRHQHQHPTSLKWPQIDLSEKEIYLKSETFRVKVLSYMIQNLLLSQPMVKLSTLWLNRQNIFIIFATILLFSINDKTCSKTITLIICLVVSHCNNVYQYYVISATSRSLV